MAEFEINIAVHVDAANLQDAQEIKRRAVAAIERELGGAAEIDAAGIVCLDQLLGRDANQEGR